VWLIEHILRVTDEVAAGSDVTTNRPMAYAQSDLPVGSTGLNCDVCYCLFVFVHIVGSIVNFACTVSEVCVCVCVCALCQIVLNHCIDRAVRDDEERSLTVCDCCITMKQWSSNCCIIHTRRPASADRTARAANFRRDLEAT